MYNINNGYNGFSMSKRAVEAYANGEKPLSKWTKSVLLEEIKYENEKVYSLSKQLTANELKKYFLKRSSWHHTGKIFQETDFYCINEEFIRNFTEKNKQEIINTRKTRTRRSKELIKKEKEEKERRKLEKMEKIEKESLFPYQNRYKTLSRFMCSDKINVEELKRIRLEKISQKREELRKQWEKQKFPEGLENINNDSFIEQYVLRQIRR